jgi:hypothetical protein
VKQISRQDLRLIPVLPTRGAQLDVPTHFVVIARSDGE